MNQKNIRKLLHSADEQTVQQIADTYQATDANAKEKIYQQVCQRKHAMSQQNQTTSETYHASYIKSIPWARNLGITTACLLIVGGTVGGMWKLTHLETPSEKLNSTAENNSNTDISTTIPTESTTFSETFTTTQTALQTAPMAVTSANTTMTETNTTTASAVTTAKTTPVITTTIPSAHKETVIASETQQAKTDPVVMTQPPATEPIVTEPQITAPPIETTNTTTTTSTTTEPAATRPAYVTAYLEICKEYEKEFDNAEYCLYDIDKDSTPELIINSSFCWTSVYTYADNQVYTLMDKYPYGTHSNSGYYFHPEYNSIYYSYTEYAGLIANQVYLTITPEHTLLETDILTSVMFDDLNHDGIPQENEPNVSDYDYNYIGKYYHNGEEFSKDEFDTWIMAHVQKTYINNRLDFKVYSDFLENLPE